jgi:hypothetical protein
MYFSASAKVHLNHSVEVEKHALIKLKPALSSKRHAPSRHECVVARLLLCFSMPALGKPVLITSTKARDCCSETSRCKMAQEPTYPQNRCGDHESQPRSCCTTSCSTLILFSPTPESFLMPLFTGHGLFTEDETVSQRLERPPIPPPRV